MKDKYASRHIIVLGCMFITWWSVAQESDSAPLTRGRTFYEHEIDAMIAHAKQHEEKNGGVGRRSRLSRKTLTPGREYYQTLLAKALERNWLFSGAIHCDVSTKAFGPDGNTMNLAALGTSGEDIRLRDIFLLARLSEQGKLGLYLGAVPANPKFGYIKEQQYLNFLAPMIVGMELNQQAINADITGMYRIDGVCWQELSLTLGFQIPLKYKEHKLDLSLYDGKLYRVGYVANAGARETTITQFFKDFESVEDFFIRAVLGSKGLEYVPVQRTLGVGDLSFFGIFDVVPHLSYVDDVQCGITLVTPTAKKVHATTLYEIELGNGGGFLLDVFGNVLFSSVSRFFNPTVQAGCEIGLNAFRSSQRISQTKVQSEKGLLRENPTLRVPVFREYYTDPFIEIDSTIPFFADAVSEVHMCRGNKIFVGCGNYIHRLFGMDSRLGIFYDYLRTGKTKFFGAPQQYDTKTITDFSRSHAHRLGWNFTLQTRNHVELSIGSQHIIAGKNVPRLHEFFLTGVIVF